MLCSAWVPTHQQPAATPATMPVAAVPTAPATDTPTTAAATPAAPVPGKPAAKKNKQVELAPEADVQNDIDDIDVQGTLDA